MHQRRRLQGLPRSFLRHLPRGQATQFGVDHREQLRGVGFRRIGFGGTSLGGDRLGHFRGGRSRGGTARRMPGR